MAKLIFNNGDNAGQEHVLDPAKESVVGRIDACEVTVANVPGVSRRHATLKHIDGEWVVEDLGSQNGIYCDNEKIKTKVLKHNDVLWFSHACLRFVDESGNGEEPAAQLDPGEATVITTTIPKSGDAKPDDAKSDAAKPDAAKPASPPPEAAGIDPERMKEVGDVIARVETEFAKVIIGQRQVLHQLLVALLSNGHCLMIGLPGLAKTLMVHTLADILDLRFKRIQFTPDLMPSDIIGSDVLEVDEETGKKSFRFIQGPIFTNMLLADEINRTPPKTQAALLEAMQERHVSVSNQSFPLPEPFFVLATQNPLEQEGTYPLPEAQLDRFMFNIFVEYPDEAEEEQIVFETTRTKHVQIEKILTGEELLRLQTIVRDLPVSPHVIKYATRLVRASRPKEPSAPKYIREYVGCGAGPRAAQFLILGAKARAILAGRLNVSCDDVRSLAVPVMRHRIFTNFTADSEDITPDDLVQRLLLNVPEPDAGDYQ